jgi:hypothetical protein
MAPSPLPHDLLSRLDRLERANRRWRHVGIGLALALLALVATGFVHPRADVLEASRLVLKGADGEELVDLGTDAEGRPQLLMRHESSYAILTLAGPGLLLRGPDGRRSAFFGIDTRGATKLELTSDRVFDGVRLAVQPDGSAGAYLLNERGRERFALEALSDGSAFLNVRDEGGRPRALFGLDPNGTGTLLLLDSRGARRLGMVVPSDGEPILGLEDAQGRSRAQLTTRVDGAPLLRLTGRRQDSTRCVTCCLVGVSK